MPVTVVVGGQFGSEGKGKVAYHFSRELGASVAVRVGGPNSGHTVIGSSREPIIFKQLPTAALLPDVTCVLPAGSYVSIRVLLEEIRVAKLPSKRLIIDPNAVVITDRELGEEGASGLRSSIGSTLSGTGAAVLARASRTGRARLARDEPMLEAFLAPTTAFLRARLQNKERVLIEGTQGFGLSVLHSPHYPYATSRDTTAAGFVAEAGLSPLDVDDVILVIRAFPIRVAGASGPLRDEITWQQITKESGSAADILELTSVTRAIRRVGRFDPSIVRQAIAYTAPTRIVLNHLDYVDSRSQPDSYTPRTLAFVSGVQSAIGGRVSHVGLGPAHVGSAPPAANKGA